MRGRLRWLNLALLALLVWSGRELYTRVGEASARHRIFDGAERPVPLPANEAPPQTARVRAEDYASIAEARLFSSGQAGAGGSAPPPEAAAESGRLPLLYGIADLGEGPVALLAARPGEKARWVRPGEAVGGFVLEDVTRDSLVFGLQGRRIRATPAELRNPATSAALPARPATAVRPQPADRSSTRSVSSAPRPARGEYRIGEEFRPGRFSADPSDGAVDGTQFGDYVRRVRRTPFGAQHWWEEKER